MQRTCLFQNAIDCCLNGLLLGYIGLQRKYLVRESFRHLGELVARLSYVNAVDCFRAIR